MDGLWRNTVNTDRDDRCSSQRTVLRNRLLVRADKAPKVQHQRIPPPPRNGQGQRGQPGQPGPQGQGVVLVVRQCQVPNAATAGSGGAFQDPSGFPPFHDWPAPQGPAITAMGKWGPVQQLTSKPTGGYRPRSQWVSTMSCMRYIMTAPTMETSFAIAFRVIQEAHGLHLSSWDMSQNAIGDQDIVARDDGSVVVVYDHALEDFQAEGISQFTKYSAGHSQHPSPQMMVVKSAVGMWPRPSVMASPTSTSPRNSGLSISFRPEPDGLMARTGQSPFRSVMGLKMPGTPMSSAVQTALFWRAMTSEQVGRPPHCILSMAKGPFEISSKCDPLRQIR